MKLFLLSVLFVIPSLVVGQLYKFDLVDTVVVNDGSSDLPYPWAGGLNAAQFSTIELNGDLLPDLFVFDRTDGKALTFINQGTIGSPEYVHAPEYQDIFPSTIRDWCLLRDFNCDGKKDLWSYAVGGAHVYKNIGTPGNVEFELVTMSVRTYYDTSQLNLFIASTDIASIDDIDGDGDLDVVSFDQFGTSLEYHRNMSMEYFGTCDSLYFEVKNNCWGHFSEHFTTNALDLLDTCDNSELGWVAELDINNVWKNIEEKRPRHSGSTVLTIDNNGDGVKDVLIGDVSYPSMSMLTNGGSAPNTNSSMISQDTTFPIYDSPITMKIFPAAYYEDITNDGVRDLIVGTNTPNQSEDDNSVLYYLNTGTDASPIFSYQQDDLLQENMIDVGTGSTPTFFDHNGDGLLDLVVSNFGAFNASTDAYEPSMSLYENVGTPSHPSYSLITTDYMSLSSSGIAQNMIPAFADLDGDGDEDMIIGDFDGRLHYYMNTAGAGNTANFVLISPNLTDTDAVIMDVGLHAAPALYDIDNDGDFDLIIGERNGNLNYFANNSSSSPSFSSVTDSLGKVRLSYFGTTIGMSVPRLFKNAAGETQLFIGGEHGNIEHFNDIDGNLGGTFTQAEEIVSDLNVGVRSTPAIGDVNGDGFPDLVIGNKKGGLQIGMGDPTYTSIPETYEAIEFSLFPNPANERFTIELSNSNRVQFDIIDISGKVVASKQISNRFVYNTSNLTSGYYLIRIKSNSGFGVKPMIIE